MKDIEKLFKESTNKLYKYYFADNDFVKSIDKISKTWWKGNYSENSFSFVDGKDKSKQELMKKAKEVLYGVFQLNQNIFGEKFAQAVGGDGHEWKEITTLHSSSLAALLCFYSVCEKLLTIENLPVGKCEFTECYFESKNMVGKDKTGKPHYSNVDVVLKGKTSDGKNNVVLFLESKFSEYLRPEKKDNIGGEVYNKIYNELTKNATEQPINELLFLNEGNTWTISYSDKKKPMYCEGIKQMISHYQGIEKSFINREGKNYDHILLGEILFDFSQNYDKRIDKGKFEDYKNMYEQLSEKLNEINNDKERFHVLPNLLTYQDVFKGFDLDDNVKKFYQL